MFKVIIIAFVLTAYSIAAQAAVIYVYENLSGHKLITDHPRDDLRGYKLVKKYGVDDNFGLPGPDEGKAASKKTEQKTTRKPISPISSRFDDLIIAEADKIGLDPALLKAMVHVESAFNPEALSPKGAMGLMQLMPATAERYGVTSREDPVASLEGGGRYMYDLLALFDQDLRLALAAYNAGENAVMKYNGIPPYPETRNYVERVIQLLASYRRNLAGV